jgi:hypothetical protein
MNVFEQLYQESGYLEALLIAWGCKGRRGGEIWNNDRGEFNDPDERSTLRSDCFSIYLVACSKKGPYCQCTLLCNMVQTQFVRSTQFG